MYENSAMVEDVCSNSTATGHQQGLDKTSVSGPSQCATTESCSERLSPDSVSKPAKCSTPDAAQQKSAKELAKVKKREDKGIGKL